MAAAATLTKSPRRLLYPIEAAQYLAAALAHLPALARGAAHPSFKIAPRMLRFDVSELDRWIESRREAA